MKKLLAILVLGLMLSSNAYALKLTKCYSYDNAHGLPNETEFRSDLYENYYYEIDFNSGMVFSYVIDTDETYKKLREGAEDFAKELGLSRPVYPEQITLNTYKITHASDRLIKAENYQEVLLGQFKKYLSIDLKKGTVKYLSKAKSVGDALYDTISESANQCEIK